MHFGKKNPLHYALIQYGPWDLSFGHLPPLRRGCPKPRPSEPLQIFPTTVHFFMGDLVFDRSKTPLPTTLCRTRAPSAPSVFTRQHRANPSWVAPYRTTGGSSYSISRRGAYPSAFGMRIAQTLGLLNGNIEDVYLCALMHTTYITCSLIDLTS